MINGSYVARLCPIMMYHISSDWRSATFKVLNKKSEMDVSMHIVNKRLKTALRLPG